MQPIAVSMPASFTIIPAGCIHWPIGEKDLLKAWVKELKETPNAYGFLMGDSMDVARTHYRSYLRAYRDDDNSQEALDAYVVEEVGKLAEILRPVAHKILGLVRGNHYWEYVDGTNSEQDLCRRLGIRYLGVTGLVQLRCKLAGSRTRNLTMFAHHTGGTSGGRTTGGDVNALTKQELTWDADIYLLGHTHRRIAFKESNMALTTKGHVPRVVERSKVFARTGAFLKGYDDTKPVPVNARHTPGYAEERAYRPTDLGWVKIEVSWRQRRLDEKTTVEYPHFEVRY